MRCDEAGMIRTLVKFVRHAVVASVVIGVIVGCAKKEAEMELADVADIMDINELGVEATNALERLGYVIHAHSVRALEKAAAAESRAEWQAAVDEYSRLITDQLELLSQFDTQIKRFEERGIGRPVVTTILRQHIEWLEDLVEKSKDLYAMEIPAGMKEEVRQFLLRRLWPAKSSVPVAEQRPILPLLRVLSNRLYFSALGDETAALNLPKIGPEAWRRMFNIETAGLARAERIERLVDELAENPVMTPSSSQTAADLLVRLGPESVEPLMAAFKSTDKNQRLWANTMLSKVASYLTPEQRREIVEADVKMLDSDDPAEWLAACRSLSYMQELSALGKMCLLALDKITDPRIEQVIDCLRRMDHAAAVPTLMKLVRGSTLGGRERASVALSVLTKQWHMRGSVVRRPTETRLQYCDRLAAKWEKWYDKNRPKYAHYDRITHRSPENSLDGD